MSSCRDNDPGGTAITGASIRVRGQVQGVGFRPTVWRLARDCCLSGEVLNDGEGVLIRVGGDAEKIRQFVERIRVEAPPLARIESLELVPGEWEGADHEFRISASKGGAVRTGVLPDSATCPDCVADVMDPKNRRYRYPFTNCTHCGPRLSIIHAVPYDRAGTAMAKFDMCPACVAEYEDPADRRFHAQPNCCPECGPSLWLEDRAARKLDIAPWPDAIGAAAELLRRGSIIAVKGIGGFHLACDATNPDAVRRLRRNKDRYDKPFAMMARDLDVVRRYAIAGSDEVELLCSKAAPIVLLDRRGDGLQVAACVAPDQATLGFMLPYTPLHHLLLASFDRPLVFTSGNRSDEPQCTSNDDARERLAAIADYWLLHDRDILNRLDDSVVGRTFSSTRTLRRARGYAPDPLVLPDGFEDAPPVLAMGAELKNTFCLLDRGRAVISAHIGDLEDARVHEDYRRSLDLYTALYDFVPEVVGIDLHPDYFSTRLGQQLANDSGIPCIGVQHHHAHVAACMAEHGVPLGKRVIGAALDGLGLGDDGELWGGEFMLASYDDFDRLARFAPRALIGGARAMREPWRNTYAHLHGELGFDHVLDRWPELDIVRWLAGKPLTNIEHMLARNINCPAASSAGRLFDAVAGALGVCRARTTYEGQAAIGLETLAQGVACDRGYGWEITGDALPELRWARMWRELLDDLGRGEPAGSVSARFHRCVAEAVATTAASYADLHGCDTVALSGGVFQNRRLLDTVEALLDARGLRPITPRRLPVNDGGLSLGQAAIAAARTIVHGAAA